MNIIKIVVLCFLINNSLILFSKDSGSNDFMIAVRYNKEKEVLRLLNEGANPNTCEVKDKNNSALLLASNNGNLKIVETLIKFGADINHINQYGINPLIEASHRGHYKIVSFLLSKNCDINKSGILSYSLNNFNFKTIIPKQHTSLSIACLNAKNSSKNNPWNQIAKLLIQKGANTNFSDLQNIRPILYTIWNHNLELTRLLLENGATPNFIPKNIKPPIALALENNQVDCIKLLIKYGAKVDIKNNLALYFAAGQKNNIGTFKLLLKNGANPNARNGAPLYFASEYGNVEKVRLLLEYGAKKNIKNKDGKIPIDIAKEKGYDEIIKLLENE